MNKKLFYSLLFASGLLLSIFMYFFLTGFGTALYILVWGNPFMTICLMLVGIVSMFSFGIATINKASRSLELTQSGSIFNFVKKRLLFFCRPGVWTSLCYFCNSSFQIK